MTTFTPRKLTLPPLKVLRKRAIGIASLVAVLLVAVPARASDEESYGLEAVLALEPDDPMINISPENVLRVCSTALDKKDSYPAEVVSNLYLLRAHAFAALGKFEEEKKDAEECLKLSPDSVPAALHHALALYQLGSVTDALKEVRRLTVKSRSASAYGTFGQMCLAGGKFDYCIEACSSAIELDPQFAPAYINRAQARLQKKDCSGAVEDLKRFIELRPLWGRTDQEVPYLFLGQAYILLHQNEHALGAYEMAKRLNPDSFEAAFGVWNSYYQAGHFRMSYALATRLIRLDKKQPRAYLAVAASANTTHRHRQALEAAKQAIALEPNFADAHEQLAAAYGGLEQYDLAIKECENAISINPEHTAALAGEAYFLATCPEKKYREGSKARELATKACKVTDYKDARTLLALAAAQAECGDFKEAVRVQKQALTLLDAKAATSKDEFEKILELFEKGRPYRGEYEPKLSDDGLAIPGDPKEP
jgi:tetratricopeptide (TPR) repeat protein